ncbi:hypothetical protein D3C81_1786480 [compost metagenome]
MGDITLGIQINDEHVQVILQVAALERIDRGQRALLVFAQISRRFVEQRLGLLGRRSRQVVTHRQNPLADALIKHMLTLDLAVRPVLPTILCLLDAVAFRHFQRVLEGFLQIRAEDFTDVTTDQR